MKKIILLFLCLAGVAASLSGQSGRQLFRYLENPALSPSQQHFLAVIRKNPVNTEVRLVSIDHRLLETPGPIVLNLEGLTAADREEITIRQVDTERRSAEEYSWRGGMEGWPVAGINFVFDHGFVHGLISTADGLYGIEPLGEDVHVLIKKSPAKFREEGCRRTAVDQGETPAERDARASRPGSERVAAVGDCRIRLLVAFTDDVFAAHANPRGEIQLATDNFNTANQNSNVEHRVELARIMQVNYAESGDDDTDLPLFRNNGDGVMDEVHAARDLYDADLCCLIVESLDACGLASAIGSSYATAFQITAFGCAAGNLSFAHEFGHLLNARHDTFVDNTAGTNHALVNVSAGWRTVMAYNDECDCSDEVSPCPPSASRATPGMPACTRIQWWSNPAVNFSGTPTGISTRCDNRTALNNNDNAVMAFEGLVINKTLSANETVAAQEEGNLLAEKTIENNAGVAVQYLNDAKGTYRAGTSITLRSGFWARSGADFRAFIDGCADNLSLQADAENRGNNSPSNEPDLRVAPNPVTDYAEVNYTVATPGQISLLLLDNLGKILKTIVAPVRQEAGAYRVEADLSTLPDGVYYLRYADSRSNRVLPLVKIDP